MLAGLLRRAYGRWQHEFADTHRRNGSSARYCNCRRGLLRVLKFHNEGPWARVWRRKRSVGERRNGGTVSPVDEPVVAFGDRSCLRPAGLIAGREAKRIAHLLIVERFQPAQVDLPVLGYEKVRFAAAGARRNADFFYGQQRRDVSTVRLGVVGRED